MLRKVSILMPVRNAMPFLEDCLKSIVQQEYSNWELIAVNDHSTDESKALLEQYSQQNGNIQSFDNQGKGIIDALQLAYSKCSGSYITRMDADDKMSPNKLSLMVEQLENYGKEHLAIGQVEYFSENKLGVGYQNYANWLNKLAAKGNSFDDIYKECVIPSPCWMLHRDDFEACGGFNSNIYPEDYDLCFRFYKGGLKVIPTTAILHYWRDYSNRTSRTDDNYADNRFLDIKCHYFLELNYDANRPLILWGAGKKGKVIAQYFIERNIPFSWATNNTKKIGKDIYGIELISESMAKTIQNAQYVIAIANPDEQNEISEFFEAKNAQPLQDYFFFC